MIEQVHYVSDGFLINLGAVLLQLCRLIKIDVTFCSAIQTTTAFTLPICTRITPTKTPKGAQSQLYYFSAELTHRAMELGAKAVHSQMLQMSQNFSRLQNAY